MSKAHQSLVETHQQCSSVLLVESSFQKGGGEGVCFNFLTLWPAVHWQRRQEGCSAKSRLRAYGGASWVAPPPGISCLAPQLGSTGIHTSTGRVWHTHGRRVVPTFTDPHPMCPPAGCCPSQSNCCTSWGWRRRRSVCMLCPGSFSPCSSSSSVCCCSS